MSPSIQWRSSPLTCVDLAMSRCSASTATFHCSSCSRTLSTAARATSSGLLVAIDAQKQGRAQTGCLH